MYEPIMAERNLIYKLRLGADLYGTVTPDSDKDFGGIFIPDKDYVLGVKRCDQVELNEKVSKTVRNQKEDVDYTIYSLPKFIHLAIGNNPNIIEFFFAHPTAVIYSNKYAKRLLEAYPLFLSRKAYDTFKGYAYSQRKKLEVKKEHMTGRRELTDKFGYDVKFASHLIRLLLECLQILVEGDILLPLPRNNLIRDIKLGKYSLDWVFKKAEEIESLVDLAYVKSDLRYSADIGGINKLQMELLEDYWRNQ